MSQTCVLAAKAVERLAQPRRKLAARPVRLAAAPPARVARARVPLRPAAAAPSKAAEKKPKEVDHIPLVLEELGELGSGLRRVLERASKAVGGDRIGLATSPLLCGTGGSDFAGRCDI